MRTVSHTYLYILILILTVFCFGQEVLRNGVPFVELHTAVEYQQLSFRTLFAAYHAVACGIFST